MTLTFGSSIGHHITCERGHKHSPHDIKIVQLPFTNSVLDKTGLLLTNYHSTNVEKKKIKTQTENRVPYDCDDSWNVLLTSFTDWAISGPMPSPGNKVAVMTLFSPSDSEEYDLPVVGTENSSWLILDVALPAQPPVAERY